MSKAEARNAPVSLPLIPSLLHVSGKESLVLNFILNLPLANSFTSIRWCLYFKKNNAANWYHCFSFFNLLPLFLLFCICVSCLCIMFMCERSHVNTTVQTWKSEDNIQKAILSFYHGFGNRTQITRLVLQDLAHLSHLASPIVFIKLFSYDIFWSCIPNIFLLPNPLNSTPFLSLFKKHTGKKKGNKQKK